MRKLRFVFITVLFLLGAFTLALFAAQSGSAPADPVALNAANNLYASGNYAAAAQMYEQLLDQGARSAAVYYNLGNAYYQMGRAAPALEAFEQAARLDPRDPDIRANLELAAATLGVPAGGIASGPLAEMALVTGDWLSLNETALLALALWFGLALLFIMRQQARQVWVRRWSVYAMALTLLVLAFVGVALLGLMALQPPAPPALLAAFVG